MKYYILLLTYISVAAAFRVIDADRESKPELDKLPSETGNPSTIKDSFYENEDSEPSTSYFDRIPSLTSIMRWAHDTFSTMMSPFHSHPPHILGNKPDEDGLELKIGSHHQMIPSLFEGPLSKPDMDAHVQVMNVNKLPPNYSNKTSEVVDSNNTKFLVNQTIQKNSGDGFSNFYVVKTIEQLPKNNTIENKDEEVEKFSNVNDTIENKDEEVQKFSNAEKTKNLPESDNRINEIDFEGPIPLDNGKEPDVVPITDDDSDYNPSKNYRMKREIKKRNLNTPSVAGKKPIMFPSSRLNRFPQSFHNNGNIRTEDLKNGLGGPISKSYVYKNIGGKTTMYIIDHRPKSQKDYADENEIVKEVGIRPPDLSRDTKVNPSGNDDQQQSLSLADPDAEVFDLNLVAKEIESRPKDK